MYILVPKKHLGKKFPQICSLKKLRSSVVSGKPKSDYKYLYSSGIINRNDFTGNNVHFGAQEKPGEKFPQICSLKKLGSSVVSGKPNSDYKHLCSPLLINQNDF